MFFFITNKISIRSLEKLLQDDLNQLINKMAQCTNYQVSDIIYHVGVSDW